MVLGKFKMKINEVTVKEASLGQLGAGLTGIGQGIAGAWRSGEKFAPIQGFKAGWQTKGAAQSQSKQVKDITTQVLQKWGAYNQKIKTNTGNDATREQAVAWLTQFFGGQKPTSPIAGDNPNPNPVQIQQWLQKEVAGYMANQEVAAAQTQQPAAELPDITKLNREELLQLKQQLQAA